MKIHPKSPVLDVSFFTPKELNRLVDTAKADKLNPKVPVYMGSYGINGKVASKIHELPGGKYAPIFSLVRKGEPYWDKRQVSAGAPAYAGPIPKPASLPPAQRYAWGVELGRRIRDQIRSARNSGVAVDSWHLDEISPTACGSTPHGVASREFLRGVMEGMYEGRPSLGDQPMKGLVYIAHPNGLAQLPLTPELKSFWKTLDKSTTRVIGETYPNFSGDPKAQADQWLSGQHALAKRGGVYADIADKYVLGASPGYRKQLGAGAMPGQTRAEVNHWRDAFMAEAKKDGVAGFGEYNWLPGNDTQPVANDVIQELAKLVAKARR